MTTGVYIDGFNLYYGCLRKTPYRWLDLEAFCERLLPSEEIGAIHYFTARVSGKVKPSAPLDQDIYLRALRTLPRVALHFGNFSTRNVWMPLTKPPEKGPRKAQVVKSEEKGSDVNLGCRAVFDALRGNHDTIVIVSNDSDLTEPVRLARYEAGVRVGVINPHPATKRSRTLSADASFFKQVRAQVLPGCQFTTRLTDQTGQFHKPKDW